MVICTLESCLDDEILDLLPGERVDFNEIGMCKAAELLGEDGSVMIRDLVQE